MSYILFTTNIMWKNTQKEKQKRIFLYRFRHIWRNNKLFLCVLKHRIQA
jgi:hypothetical protein